MARKSRGVWSFGFGGKSRARRGGVIESVFGSRARTIKSRKKSSTPRPTLWRQF